MLTRFALLAVVVVALAQAKREKNACGEALKPDNFKEIISGWKADCKDEEDKRKCMATKHGWVTDAGVFDEAAFRTYIADKIATASLKSKPMLKVPLMVALPPRTWKNSGSGRSCVAS